MTRVYPEYITPACDLDFSDISVQSVQKHEIIAVYNDHASATRSMLATAYLINCIGVHIVEDHYNAGGPLNILAHLDTSTDVDASFTFLPDLINTPDNARARLFSPDADPKTLCAIKRVLEDNGIEIEHSYTKNGPTSIAIDIMTSQVYGTLTEGKSIPTSHGRFHEWIDDAMDDSAFTKFLLHKDHYVKFPLFMHRDSVLKYNPYACPGSPGPGP